MTQPWAPSLGVSYDTNNHQLELSYDANGNQLWDAQHATAYGWNVENRLATETSQAWPGPETFYSYDPWGRRVMKDVNGNPNGYEGGRGYEDGAWEFYFYGITGEKLATAVISYNSVGGLNWGPANYTYNVYFGGKLLNVNGAYVVTDRLGSVRARSSPWNGWTRMSYFPYGEERTATPDVADKFGTYFRDGAGQDYAGQRYYNNGTGRFWSVDPGGIRTASLSRPASWNRYAYVEGDPVNSTDRHGLFMCLDCGDNEDPDDPCDDDSTMIGCGGGGGNGWTSSGSGAGDQGGGSAPKPPRLGDLVAASIMDVLADLSKPDCAGDFKSVSKTLDELSHLGLKDYGEPSQATGANGVETSTGEYAQYNPFTKSINLNSNRSLNWADPTQGQMLINGTQTPTNYIAGELQFLGLPASTAMSGTQFMDMVILHELAHYDGTIGNPDVGSNEVKLWNDCVKQ